MDYPVYNLKGEKSGKINLSQKVFGVAVNNDLLHQVIVSHQSNKRKVVAHTKTRGEVRGGGVKPWKQKGTGRARHGSIRSPIWVGGGVSFGPRNNRNFKKKINKKMKAKGLLMALSEKAKNNQIVIFENMIMEEPKTKVVAQAISKVLDMRSPKVLFVLDLANKNARLASRNCKDAKVVSAVSLNALDILSKKFVVMSKSEVEILENNLQI